jgi:hypothetical protein
MALQDIEERGEVEEALLLGGGWSAAAPNRRQPNGVRAPLRARRQAPRPTNGLAA